MEAESSPAVVVPRLARAPNRERNPMFLLSFSETTLDDGVPICSYTRTLSIADSKEKVHVVLLSILSLICVANKDNGEPAALTMALTYLLFQYRRTLLIRSHGRLTHLSKKDLIPVVEAAVANVTDKGQRIETVARSLLNDIEKPRPYPMRAVG